MALGWFEIRDRMLQGGLGGRGSVTPKRVFKKIKKFVMRFGWIFFLDEDNRSIQQQQKKTAVGVMERQSDEMSGLSNNKLSLANWILFFR